MSAPGRAIPPESRPGGPFPGTPGPPTPPGVLSGSPRPSGGARRRRAGSSAPWWSLRWPSSATHTPPSPGGGPRPPGGRGSPPSPGPHRPGPPLPPVPALPAAPTPPAPMPLRTPAPPGQRPSVPVPPVAPVPRGRGSAGVAVRVGGRLVGGPGGLGGDQVPHVGVDVLDGLVVVVGVVRRHLVDTRGDAPHRLDVRLRGRPAPLPSSCALPFPPRPRAPSCLPPGAHLTLPLLAPGPRAYPQPLARARSLPSDLWPVSRVPTSVTRALAFSACARVLPVPLPVSFVVPCVPPSAARALARPVCPSSPAAPRRGALPVSLPSLIAACALARPLCPSRGAPFVAVSPSPRVPVAGTPPRPFAVSPLLDHAPGVSLPLQLRQRDARRRTLGRRGADGPRPPLGEGGLGRGRLGGAGVGVAGLRVGAVLGALPALRRGCGGPRAGARVGPVPLAHPPPPPRGWRGRGRGLSGVGGHPGRHGLLGQRLGVVGGRLGLLGRRPDRYRGHRQPPLLALREGFPRAPQGDPRGAGPAILSLEGAIGVRHRWYPGRHAWLQACPSHYRLVHQLRAVGSAVWCREGGEGGGGGCGGDGSGRSRVGGHPPALGREAGEPLGPLAAPQLPVWGGALGPRGS